MAISLTSQEKKILQSVTIPPRPEVLLQFSEEAKKPEPDINKIAEILQSDVGIGTAILQVVNSAAFRRNKEIESISQAVMVLGLKRVVPLVKAVALKNSVSANALLTDFWQSQTEIAEACSFFCEALNKPNLSNHCYMLGLFHAVGVPILSQHFDTYDTVINQAKLQGWTSATELEFQQYNTCHTTIGALLAQQWKLPKPMILVIYYQHDSSGIYQSGELDKLGLELFSILKIARHFSCDFSPEEDEEWQTIRDDCLDFLGISEEELEEINENYSS